MAHAQNPTVGEEFWSTTTIEVDPADLRAPIHGSSWDLDMHGVGSSHNLGESANHGNSFLNLHICSTGVYSSHVHIFLIPLQTSNLILAESPVFRHSASLVMLIVENTYVLFSLS